MMQPPQPPPLDDEDPGPMSDPGPMPEPGPIPDRSPLPDLGPMPARERAPAGPSGRMKPQDLTAERAVLGAILLSNSAGDIAYQILEADDYYKPAHQHIYKAMRDLHSNGSAVDVVTLQAHLSDSGHLEKVGGAPELAELAEAVPTASNVEHYSERVRGKAVLRRLIEAGSGMVDVAFSGTGAIDALDQAEQSVLDIRKRSSASSISHVKDVLKATFKRIEKLYAERREITGVPTGYPELDKKTAGLQPSDLIIIAGRPGMGKTAFALNLATQAALEGDTAVAVFSLEMGKEQLAMRMLCSEGRIDATRMRGGMLTESDWPKLAKAAGAISETKVFIDDTGSLSLMDTRSKCRRIAAEHNLGLVVIDYLQLMRGSPNAQSREQEISEISRGLKALAKELSIPVIALSQLNRGLESRTDKRPGLADLRESGAIEQDADVIMFVYRDEYYNPESPDKGVAEVIIGKQRSGPTGTVKLKFFPEYTRFENLMPS